MVWGVRGTVYARFIDVFYYLQKNLKNLEFFWTMGWDGARVEILEKAERARVTAGKDPMGLAAAALYIACVINHEKHTQKMIIDAAGVTEVTIRNRYKSLKKSLNLNI